MSRLKKPNTFIIGAPKCGTTALAEYLRAHPNVFMSQPKEPHHFISQEWPNKTTYSDHASYLDLFKDANSTHQIVAEASVWYLYSETAISRINEYDPNARYIAMIRRPDEMVYSMHNQSVITFNEDIKSFEKAWSIATSGNRKSVPKHCREIKLLDYHKIAAYSEQLERLYNIVPSSNVLVIFHDDFKHDTHAVYNRVCNFLELSTDYQPTFEKVNENKENQIPFISKIVLRQPTWVKKSSKLVKKLLCVEKLNIRPFVLSLNQKNTQRKPLDPKLRRSILSHYSSDIKKLEKLTGRDLADWLL